MVTAAIGDLVEIALRENPSTGYRWEISKFDGRIVSPEESSFSVAPGAIGAAGRRRMTFRTRDSGAGRIELVLRRSWEPASAAVARWAIAIEVNDGRAEAGRSAAGRG